MTSLPKTREEAEARARAVHEGWRGDWSLPAQIVATIEALGILKFHRTMADEMVARTGAKLGHNPYESIGSGGIKLTPIPLPMNKQDT